MRAGHQCSANALVSPRRPHVNTPDTAHFRTAGKGITVKAAHGNQQALIQMAAEDLSRTIEAILCAGPLLHQGFNEVVALGLRLRLQMLHAWKGQLNFLDRDHLPSNDTEPLSGFAVLRFESLFGIIHLIAMGKRLAVSVLDLVGMRPGEPAGSAIARSVDLAQHVEQLGYQRYWLAEHHSIAGLACSATAVLIGHVAAATKTIRVGSGGVMLPNHAPLVVAEQFGTLEALYPGRIDLGLGRAPGGDFATMRALRRDLHQSGDDFPALLEELRTYLGPEKPGQAVKAIPGQGSNVPITLLGSSGFSAQLAAMLGLPFAFAAHFAPEYLYAAAQMYRDRFQPSAVLRQPHLMVGVQVIAAETDAAARRLFTTPAAAFSAIDPQSAGGVVASGGFHGAAVAGV